MVSACLAALFIMLAMHSRPLHVLGAVTLAAAGQKAAAARRAASPSPCTRLQPGQTPPALGCQTREHTSHPPHLSNWSATLRKRSRGLEIADVSVPSRDT